MSKYPSTNIVYSGLEDRGGPTITIVDEKKNKWTIWKADYEHKDQQSEAYASLQNYKIGESFGVEYGEKQESFVKKDGPDAGKTINFTRRTIYKILPLVSNPASLTTPEPEKPHSGQNFASGGLPGGNGRPPTDAFGRRLGIQGHINALLGNTKIYPTNSVESVVALAIRIEDEAERQLAGGTADEHTIGDDIPFED